VRRDFGVSRKAATSAWSRKARKSLDNPFGARVSPMSQVPGQTGDLGFAGGPRPTMSTIKNRQKQRFRQSGVA
jgi:hypothetical protein